MEPDPKCKWCKGSGEIRLLIRVVPCECTQPSEDGSEIDKEEVEKSLNFGGL